MGDLVENMQCLSDEIIGSFIRRKKNLCQLEKEVDAMLAGFEAERRKMSAELQARLTAFLLDLEKRVGLLFKQFEEERAVFQRELMLAEKIFAEMEAKMERLRKEGCR